MSKQKTSEATVNAIRAHRLSMQAHVVSERARASAIARAYGVNMCLTVERAIFVMADRLLPEYRGALWDFVQLANGGFYLSLCADEQWECSVDGNSFHDSMSGDAAGIVICLMTYSHMSFSLQGPAQTLISDHFYKLREYASEHPEASLIFAAID
jgi:Antirestriction protein